MVDRRSRLCVAVELGAISASSPKQEWSDGSLAARTRDAPAIITAGPLSPPIASIAIRGPASIASAPVLVAAQASVETISRPL